GAADARPPAELRTRAVRSGERETASLELAVHPVDAGGGGIDALDRESPRNADAHLVERAGDHPGLAPHAERPVVGGPHVAPRNAPAEPHGGERGRLREAQPR